MPPNCPKESEEQSNFVKWLEAKNLLFSATAQSTWTSSMNQIMKNKRMGVRKGVPDMLVVIPQGSGENILVFVEMKRRKIGKVSPEQTTWMAALNLVPGVKTAVCHGAEEAINFIKTFLPEKSKQKSMVSM